MIKRPPEKVVIPPQGRRKKRIVLEAAFLDNEPEGLEQEQNQTILKLFIRFKSNTG